MSDNLTTALRLVLVTDDLLLGGRDLAALAREAVAGGVTAIQLRLKHATARELVAHLLALRAAVTVPLFVNDRPDIAAAAGVGVHLGPDDLSPLMARSVLGPGPVIGASVGGEQEIARAAIADYWGIGPWRVTSTKPDAGSALGPSGFAKIAGRAGGKPRIAIGGIRPDDVGAVITAGGTGVAVISGILGADNVTLAARRYADSLEAALAITA